MKRPEKKEFAQGYPTNSNNKKNEIIQSYNQACEDWEKFLPNEEEIKEIITDFQEWARKQNQVNDISSKLALTIHKRLKGGKR